MFGQSYFYGQQSPYAQQGQYGYSQEFYGLGPSAVPMTGIAGSAAQTLHSQIPAFRSTVMNDFTQTNPQPWQTGFIGQAPFPGFGTQQGFQPQFQGYQPQIQSQYQTHPQYQTQPYFLSQQQYQPRFQGQYQPQFQPQFQSHWQPQYGISRMQSGLGTTPIMSSAAGTLQSNINTLRGNVLNDWSLTVPENQQELWSQQAGYGVSGISGTQSQFGGSQMGASPIGSQISGTYGQSQLGGLYGQSQLGGSYGQSQLGGSYGQSQLGSSYGQSQMGASTGQSQLGGSQFGAMMSR